MAEPNTNGGKSWARLSALLVPPDFDAYTSARQARLLYRVLVVAYPVLLLLTGAAWFGDSATAKLTYPLQCVVVLLVLGLLRRGLPRVATGLMLLSVWALSTVTIVEEGGAGSAAMGSYALIVLMAGFFWNVRGALGMVFVTVCSTAVLVYAPERLGLPALPTQGALRYLAETTAQVLVTAFLLHFALELIRQAAEERRNVELAAAAAKLELEQRTREAQKFEAIGRLAGGVAHDFRNMLTVILGEADMAQRENPGLDLEAIIDASQHANRLAAQLLAVGKQQELSLERVDLNALLRASEPVLRSVSGGAELELALANDECWVRADPNQLERVLVNLVANARDAMGQAGVIRIESVRESKESRITVVDHGPGMLPEVQARIFEPFFSTKGEKGTGLGLATAHGIVAQSGGRLTVDSRVGVGTRMSVYLPTATAA